MINFLPILSILPFGLFLFLLLFKKTSLLKVSLLTLLLVLTFIIFIWRIQPIYLPISFAKGILIAFDIFIIIFGAIFFLDVLRSIKIIENISYYLESFSKDYRVKVILLAWFFENFIEGTAGFGTPAAVIAPILISLGLEPITAVVISLLGNSTSVAFGAAGTPIRVGFAGVPITSSVPFYTALINLVGFVVPIFILWTAVANQKDRKTQFLEALPLAAWAGILFVIPALLTVSLGQEFPSIFGAIIGIFLMFLSVRLKLFIPKNVRSLRTLSRPDNLLPPVKAFFPYALLVALLILGKFLLGSFDVTFFSGLTYKFNLFNPGFAFILAAIVVVILWKEEVHHVTSSLLSALKRTIEPFLVIAAMSSMVQLMLNTSYNTTGFLSPLDILAKSLATPLLPFISPIIGAFGSFLTGSATVSDIMFGNILYKASQAINLNPSKILALELVGAAAGNMIAIADILAVLAVVGLRNKEREILKGVIIPCTIYVLLASLVGIISIKLVGG